MVIGVLPVEDCGNRIGCLPAASLPSSAETHGRAAVAARSARSAARRVALRPAQAVRRCAR
jgi:hypothetical protein